MTWAATDNTMSHELARKRINIATHEQEQGSRKTRFG